MNLMDTMANRRSVRSFTSDPVASDDIKKILQAGMLGANGKGLRPWEFIVVQDKNSISKLINCRKGGAKMLETATAAIIVFSDSDKTDTYVEDSAVAMSNMHLMASGLGLGSCWLQVRLRPSDVEGQSSEAFIRKFTDTPDNMQPEALLAIGHVESSPAPNPLPEIPNEKVHYEKW